MHTLKLEGGNSILLDLVIAHTAEDQGTFWDDGNTSNLDCSGDDRRAHVCQNLEEVPFLVHERFSVKVISKGLRVGPSLSSSFSASCAHGPLGWSTWRDKGKGHERLLTHTGS